MIVRAVAVLCWCVLCLAVWFAWLLSVTYNAHADPNIADPDRVVAISGCIVSGCVGSVWLGGLLGAALVWSLVRR